MAYLTTKTILQHFHETEICHFSRVGRRRNLTTEFD